MHAIFHKNECRDEVRKDIDAKLLLNKIMHTSRNNLIIAHQNIDAIG